VSVVFSDLNGYDALAGSRHTDLHRQESRNALSAIEAPQSGRREHQSIIVARVQFPEPRVEVAANREKLSGRSKRGKLRYAANAAGSNARCVSQRRTDRIDILRSFSTGAKDDRIARVLSGKNSGDRQSFGQKGWHVLAAVNSKIDLARKQGVLDLFHEETLASDFGQWRFAKSIAGCLDHHDLACRPCAIAKERGDSICLVECERASSGADPECGIHVF
jgi:hypothetical protein